MDIILESKIRGLSLDDIDTSTGICYNYKQERPCYPYKKNIKCRFNGPNGCCNVNGNIPEVHLKHIKYRLKDEKNSLLEIID